jgi:uncharacterized protein (DUF4415 family)
MRAHYDFSKAKKNPYAKLLKKKQVTLRLDEAVLSYFKELGLKKQLPWQTLVNLYLRSCADEKKEPHIEWHAP